MSRRAKGNGKRQSITPKAYEVAAAQTLEMALLVLGSELRELQEH